MQKMAKIVSNLTTSRIGSIQLPLFITYIRHRVYIPYITLYNIQSGQKFVIRVTKNSGYLHRYVYYACNVIF